MKKSKSLPEHAEKIASAIVSIMGEPMNVVEAALRESLPAICEDGWSMPSGLAEEIDLARKDPQRTSALLAMFVQLGVTQHQIAGKDPLLAVVQRKAREARNQRNGRS
jgi:hypothetical protein